MPSNKIISQCFVANRDGAGYMLPFNGKVIIRKGFMCVNSLKNDFDTFVRKHDIDILQTPIVFHFRIATHGGVKKELCHPYPVCENYDNMRNLSGTCDIALAHNGIIRLTTSNSRYINTNDTMIFIKDYVSLIIDHDIYFGANQKKCLLIQRLIETSRLAIMCKNGYVNLIGKFEEEKGIYYSNMFWKWKPLQWFTED